jgi:hypothetical protein
VNGTCHCGAVTITIPRAPSEVTDCNCTLCDRLGVLWAYYDPRDVIVVGPTQRYQRTDMTATLYVERCAHCGVTIAWRPLANRDVQDRMGVNARLFSRELRAAAALRRLDGLSWREDLTSTT